MKVTSIIKDKKGGQIVEATICLPIYILSILLLSSIILYYSAAENTVFSTADELRLAAAEAKYVKVNPLLPGEIKNRISDENSIIKECHIDNYGYHESYMGLDEVIIMDIRCSIGNDVIPFKSKVDYELSLMARAFVGTTKEISPMSIEEFQTDSSETVYIFPNYGECYHNENCILIKTGHEEVILTDELAGKLNPCDTCNSGTASIGDVVYVMPGDSTYHLGGCEMIERRYIKIEKITAIERGYRPCSKCGG